MGLSKCGLSLLVASAMAAQPVRVPFEMYQNVGAERDNPGQAPLISTFAYRNLADHLIDPETQWFDPDVVQCGDIVYVGLWYIEWFAAHIHPAIRHPYILLSCDAGNKIPGHQHVLYDLLYDPKLAAWFCRNIIFSQHPKFFQIPQGQNLEQWSCSKAVRETLQRAVAKADQRKGQSKRHLLYMNHMPRAHGDRERIVDLFRHQPFCYCPNHTPGGWRACSREQYYEDLINSRFVLSPFGLESDSVRTWEALALGCIPIVEHTFLDEGYKDLPVMIVYDWADITPDLLEREYQRLKDRSIEQAHIAYWADLIRSTQEKVRAGSSLGSQLDATLFQSEEIAQLAHILKANPPVASRLLYKGALCSLRPFQLSQVVPALKEIFVCDPYLEESVLPMLERWDPRGLCLSQRRKITLMTDGEITQRLKSKPCTLFLDLTHCCVAVLLHEMNLRQHLESDISQLYDGACRGSMIICNRASDRYVETVIDRIGRSKGIVPERSGNFYILRK